MVDQNKIEKEPFYNNIYYTNRSLAEIEEYGFFFDNNDTDIDWELHSNLLCTPINFLSKEVTNKPKCILIATGAMSPLHQGHIDMMVAAKKELSKNWNVIGGYLSPGHDEYIKYKTGDQWIPIHDRLNYANTLIKDYDWLAIDPWEGVFAPGAVNFTSVIWRLDKYIKKHLEENITIMFVCGSDNARFASTFINYSQQEIPEFGCVIVTRPGHMKFSLEFCEKTNEMKNVYFAECNCTLSSTEIRNKGFKIPKKPDQCHLRIKWTKTENLVKFVLKKYFSSVWIHNIKDQLDNLQSSIGKDVFMSQIINLDVESELINNIKVSRLYDLYGQKHLGFTNRPNTKTLDKQFRDLKLSQKEYYLFDDDICSGKTMDYVESELNKLGKTVKGRLSYITSNKNTEVLDALDFILGSGYGLVIEYQGKLKRVPYMYPFVCPTTRASIDNPLDFSIDMWQLNIELYTKYGTLNKPFSQDHYFKHLGFNTPLELSEFYYKFLNDIKKYYI